MTGYQRIDQQTVSLHYVNALAVCDRINFSSHEFSSQKNKVTWHIPSEHSEEMETKYDVVSVLAVLITHV